MKLSTLLIKYILHQGVRCAQSTTLVGEEHIDMVSNKAQKILSIAREVYGNAEGQQGNIYHMFSQTFKGKRYKDCKLDPSVNSIKIGQRIKFLIIENPEDGDLPLILYHEPA